MANEKTLFQLLVERVATDPALKEKVRTADVDAFVALLAENGVQNITTEQAEEVLGRLKAVFSQETGELSEDALDQVAGGAPDYGTSCFRATC